jgi:hypothetical protein
MMDPDQRGQDYDALRDAAREEENTVTSDAELPTTLSRSELKYWDR